MKVRRQITVTGLAMVGILFAGCGRRGGGAGGPGGMGGMGGAGPPTVSVITVATGRVVPTTELTGRVAASRTAEVRPQVSGILRKRLFVEGADVKEGDVLYQIEPASYQAAYDGAQAALAKAEANVEPLRLRAERYQELVADEAVSQQDLEDAVAAHKLAVAEVEAAKAAVETARIQLEYTKVTAPIDGRIGRSMVTDGALVTSGQAMPLATIQQLDPVFVDVTQSSAEMLRLRRALESGRLVREGGEARVRLFLDDGSEYGEAGTLKFSEAFVDQGTGSVTLRTLFPNPKLVLLPGMFARAVLAEGVAENAILVPQRVVTHNPAGQAMVMAVNEAGVVEPRVITVERTVADQWLVSSGLAPGDRIIIEGLQRARPGTPVQAVPYEPGGGAAPGGAPGGAEAGKGAPAREGK